MRSYSRGAKFRIVAILAMGIVLTAFIVSVKRLSQEPLSVAQRVTVPRSPFRFATNEDCKACHLEIWEEWIQDEHSKAWFNEPLLPKDPKRTECNNCHAPEPILEIGIEELAVIRTSRFEEGVGCIECHRNVDHVEGPLATREAACNPVQNDDFTKSNICNSCHAPHGSFEEWKNSEWAKKGFTCQSCHMPEVERRSATGGLVRKVRSHRMRSQRDVTMLKEAMTFDAILENGKILVTLSNVGAGHNIPGEIFNREILLTTVFTDSEGEETAWFRESMKTVKREQRATEKSTQLTPGESRSWSYDLPAGKGKVSIAVKYKYFFLFPDEAAVNVYEKVLEF